MRRSHAAFVWLLACASTPAPTCELDFHLLPLQHPRDFRFLAGTMMDKAAPVSPAPVRQFKAAQRLQKSLAEDLPINAGLSGSWFQPAQSGQGFSIEVIAERRELLAYWFTHAAVAEGDEPKTQRWLLASGSYSDTRAALDLFLVRGGRFDAPPMLGAIKVGSATLRFADCARGQFEYQVSEGAIRGWDEPLAGRTLTGTIALERLSPDVLCTSLEAPASAGQHAFVGVQLVEADLPEAQTEPQTVLVDGAQIVAVGPVGSVRIPQDARIVPGHGWWLSPGLTDFHTHIRPLGYWPDDSAGNFIMYLANGITSVVNMGDATGAPRIAQAAVRRGDFPGPEIYPGLFARGASDGGTASTFVRTIDEAEAHAQRALSLGYDFIKPYDGIPPAAFATLARSGRSLGLPLLGHTNAGLSLDQLLADGRQQMVVHALTLHVTAFGGQVRPDRIAAVSQSLRRHGTALSPTLWVSQLITEYGLEASAGRPVFDHVLRQRGVEYMDERALTAWVRMLGERPDVQQAIDRRPQQQFLAQFSRQFHTDGVVTLLGSDDIGIPGVVPGFALHQEIRQLTAAGLDATTILRAGTRVAGDFIGREFRGRSDRIGRVAPGHRADLLLLDRDPRRELATLERPVAVMAAGRHYPGRWLRSQLEALRAR